jgi:hypothetical protein
LRCSQPIDMPPALTTAWFGEFKGEQFQHLPPSNNYNPEDPFADPVAKLEHRDAVVREKFVHVAKCQVRSPETDIPPTRSGFWIGVGCAPVRVAQVGLLKRL